MSTTPKLSLPTLEKAYRLRTLAAPKPQDQDRRRQQSRWNGNGQGATNDSAEYKAAVKIVDGFPVEYSCIDDPRESDIDERDIKELTVSFDYEMKTRTNADVTKSMRSLEWSLLWNVARNLGLHNCNYRKQDPLFETRRRLATPSGNFVLGLSSLDFDRVDDATTHCTVLTNDVDERTTCTPMIGTMTANFTGDEDAVKRYLELNIQEEMNSRRVRIEEVKECRFIGDRSLLNPNASTRETLDSKNNSTNLALVFGVLAGVFMLCFALLMAKGRRRRRESVLDDDDPLPIPVPPIAYEKQNSESIPGIQPSSSGDTEESIPDRIEIEEEPIADRGLQPVSVASIATGKAPIPSDSYQEHHDVDEGSDTDGNLETADANENLDVPHLPAVFVVPVDNATTKEPIESKTLRTRRKRKKKKKKKVLKRVSSKQSINEMETINEDGDEGSEFEDGSEYSASCSEYSEDDEDDRLLIMHTPTDSSSDNGNSPKVSPGPVVPPSPIREEPKIRRLPPPWI